MIARCLLAMLLLIPVPLAAGIPQTIHPTTGNPVGWQSPHVIPAMFDTGPLGLLSNVQARALVESMIGIWEEVTTATVTFSPLSLLPDDVTEANIGDYLDGTICTDDFPSQVASMESGESPVIFDHDGTILDLLAGEGASKKIVGKSAYRCYTGTLKSPAAATQSFIILNGRFLDGKAAPEDLGINVYAGIILHELGHFLGLHHSMVNETIFQEVLDGARPVEDSRYLPVMYPLVLHDAAAPTVLKPDDVAAISALYPTETAKGALGMVGGVVWQADGKGFRGANVVARRQDDPLCQAIATVSGRYCTPLVNELMQPSLLGDRCLGDAMAQGTYRIDGLAPGEYTIEVSEIVSTGGARANMFPKFGDLTLPGGAEFYDTDENATDAAENRSVVAIDGGKTIDGLDIVLGTSSATTTPSINLALFSPNTKSTCAIDPVNYQELLASTANLPLSSNEDAFPSNEDDATSTSATNAKGCTLMASPQASRSGLGGLVIVIVCSALVVFRMRRRRMVPLLVAVLLFGASPMANGESMLPTTPEELTELAGTIIHGTCDEVRSIIDERGFLIFEVSYRVHRLLKGTAQDRVTFRSVASVVAGDEQTAPFRPGTEEVLFLYPVSAWGYTSPVAGTRGRMPLHGMSQDARAEMVRNIERIIQHQAPYSISTFKE